MFHIPVLLKEVVQYLNLRSNENVIDATIGGGGHAQEILEKISPRGQLIGLDLDPEALKYTQRQLKTFGQRVHLYNENYNNLRKIYNGQFPDFPIHAILLDLGLSSFELKDKSRGFSFLKPEAPLDMRFSGQGITAADILNTYSRDSLIKILSEYGQEIHTRQIVAEIVRTRQKQKFFKVDDLTAAVLRVYKNKLHSHKKTPWVGKIHPATKTFLALRIAVNDELDNLRQALPQMLEILISGGRLVVITFHSLEDRIVKDFLRRESRDCICPRELPVCRCQHQSRLKVLTPKAVRPTAEEVRNNSLARSAQLRVAEKK